MRRTLAVALVIVLVAAAAGYVTLRRRSAVAAPPSAARLESLRQQRDALRGRLREILIANGERSLERAPQAGVMIGVPTAFTSSILEQAVTGLFGDTVLTLRDLRVRKHGEVKARILFANRTVGRYALDMRIREVRGLLRPGKPTLRFGGNRVDVELPVQLARGAGEADLRFRWDSRGLANVVCGDVDVTRRITGAVAPQDYRVAGSFAISAHGDAVLLRPEFPDLAVRVFVDPSEQAWSVVDAVIRDRPKGCEIALGRVDVQEKLQGVLGRGFRVKVPRKILAPVRLPAGVRRSLDLQGLMLALSVKPTGLLVADDRLWYGADVTVRSRRAAGRR